MAELKLSRRRDRTPVNLAISMSPHMHKAQWDFIRTYAESSEENEAVSRVNPVVLAASLECEGNIAWARQAANPAREQ